MPIVPQNNCMILKSPNPLINKRGSFNSPKTRGFAVVIALMLMGFILALTISLSILVQTETVGAAQSKDILKARMNALLGFQQALGKLQQTAGPDQRITAPATTALPARAELITMLQNHASPNGGFQSHLDAMERNLWDEELREFWVGRNPHWTGVWDTTLKNNDGLPDREQAPVWLVSGNVGRNPEDSDYLKPDQILPDPSVDPDYVWLVNRGSATGASESANGLDGRVSAPRMPADEDGHYAWWVSDESTKISVGLYDPFSDETDIGSTEYRNRLSTPQRHAWELSKSFLRTFIDHDLALPLNDQRIQDISSLNQLPLFQSNPDNQEHLLTALREQFHDTTTVARTVLADPIRGGLKRDLTVFFEDGASATNGGINLDQPIPDPDGSDPLNYRDDPRFAKNNNGFPFSDNNIPTWRALLEWYQNEAVGGTGGSVRSGADFMPMVTYFRLFVGFSRDGDFINLHFAPVVVLWNPFDARLQSAPYTLQIGMDLSYEDFHVVTRGGTDPDSMDNADGFDYIDDYMHALQKPAASEGIDPDNVTLRDLSFSGSDYSNVGADMSVLQRNEDQIILQIPEVSFEAGESLVFGIGYPNDRQIMKTAAGYELELENIFFADQPTTAYLPVLRFRTGTAPPLSADVRFISKMSVGTDYDLVLSGPENTTVSMRDFGAFNQSQLRYYLSQGKPLVANTFDPSNSAFIPPDQWRHMHPLGMEFATNIIGAQDTVELDASLFPAGETWLTPMSKKMSSDYRERILSGHPDQHKQTNRLYRAFATHNLSAKDLGRHPLIDRGRNSVASLNADQFERLSYTNSTIIGTSHPTPIGLKWGESFTDETSGAARGSSLITFLYPPPGETAEFEASPFLPIRLVKRSDFELASIGQLQQVNLSPFLWQPAFPIGNAEASPYVDREAPVGISRRIYTGDWQNSGVANDNANTLVDLSYLLNDSLWDRYFLSTIPQSGNFDPQQHDPLPNSRNQIINSPDLLAEDLRDFNTTAAHLLSNGTLNVNSTSVDAWTALISAFRDLEIEGNGVRNPENTVPVSRTPQPLQEAVDFTFNMMETNASSFGAVSSERNYEAILGGFRYLTDEMVRALAQRIVDEVRLRGPFFSLADFVNRRLVPPDRSSAAWLDARTEIEPGVPAGRAGSIDTSYDPLVGLEGINGTLQRAINLSGINGGTNYPAALQPLRELDRVYGVWDRPFHDGVWSNTEAETFNASYGATRHYLDFEHMTGMPAGEVGQLMSHTPGFVTQGDLLAMIGSALTARGDTFRIRTYGDLTDPLTDKVRARAWLEAIVQRMPEPVVDSNQDFEPDAAAQEMGRRFRVLSLRWLTEDEI